MLGERFGAKKKHREASIGGRLGTESALLCPALRSRAEELDERITSIAFVIAIPQSERRGLIPTSAKLCLRPSIQNWPRHGV